jgi:WD40 repeat protein
MKKRSHFLLLFLLFGLFACSTGGTLVPTETTQAQPTFTQTKPFATETPDVMPTVTAAPTETMLPTTNPATALAEAHLTIKCLDISPDLPENAGLSGQVFLSGFFVNGKGYSGPDSKIDLRTGTLIQRNVPENTRFGGYKVSPDGKRLAYWKILYSTDKKQVARSIVIEDYEGKILKDVPADLETWDTVYWLDNDRVVIGMYGQPYALNPFTGKKFGFSEWYSQSPGGLKTISVWDVNGVFDSQLSRLFYIQEDDTLLLWDLQTKEVLARLEPHGKYPPFDRPKWSWNNKEVVVGYTLTAATNSGEELFSVSRDGIVTQLTELGKYYVQVRISKISWSPDGRKVAFFFRDLSEENSSSQLAILDRETLQVTNYCDLSGLMFTRPDVEPVWSPDSKKLLIGRMESDLSTVSTVLVDISNEYAVRLAENLVPAGWMVAP